MTSTESGRSPTSPSLEPGTTGQPGPFMLTLCRVTGPLSIRAPQTSQLKQFKFFTSRARGPDGSERVYLHMGYFATIAAARGWAQFMHSAYPDAIACPVPPALLRQPNSGVPTLAPANAAGSLSPTVSPGAPTPAGAQPQEPSLTDTQVLNILETRRVSPVGDRESELKSAQISLMRPNDTGTRRVLKEAVVRRAPVFFAVQLESSAEPIDLSAVPANSIFKAYTLYTAQGQHEGRSCHSLRLGFFSDAISAKQVAYYVRASFPSVAVVPVTDEERDTSAQTRINPTQLMDPFARQLDQALDEDRAATAAQAASRPAQASSPLAQASSGSAQASTASASSALAQAVPTHAPQPGRATPARADAAQPSQANPIAPAPARSLQPAVPHGTAGAAGPGLATSRTAQPRTGAESATARSGTLPRGDAETLEQTLEMLAASELWKDDSVSDTGVRHLTVQVEQRAGKRS